MPPTTAASLSPPDRSDALAAMQEGEIVPLA